LIWYKSWCMIISMKVSLHLSHICFTSLIMTHNFIVFQDLL
jgi:hypothetical protein